MSKDERSIRVDIDNLDLSLGVDNKGFNDVPEPKLVPNYDGRLSIVSKKKSIQVGDNDDENVDRQSWDNPIEFLLSCISMSVGLANIWRFPYAAYTNGGGAFVIPYIIVLIFIGRPIYFLEMTLGQFASFGYVKVWAAVPFFKGIGYIGMMAAVVTLSYYCTIIATAFYYLAVSFQTTLPWTVCKPEWGPCDENTAPFLYFSKVVTEQKYQIDDGLGWPLLYLTICLAVSWIVIFLSLMKGVESSGKVAYFTAIFPYVVLFTFLIRGVTLEGSVDGVSYFITPQWDKIYDPNVWYAAVGQCFFSLGTGNGPITIFASYNPFKHTAYRDAFIISLMDTFTSLLAGFTIFSVLGHLAWATGTEVADVAGEGPGLIFVSYPSAISKFTWAPQLFAVLFFLMLLTLGIGSANALAGVPIAILSDQFPKVKKWQMALICCILGFFSGLIYVTPGGQFMVTFVDHYGVTLLLYVVCMVEAIAIAWFYGLHKYIRDMEFMLDVKLGWYWIICWGGLIPVGLFTVLIYKFATEETLRHESLPFPDYVHIIGWGVSIFALLMLPAWGLHSTYLAKGDGFLEKFKRTFSPKKKWGPRATKFRKAWELFKAFGEMKFRFDVSDSAEISLSVRGAKERMLVTPESNSITIRIYNLNENAEIEHLLSAPGIQGYCHRLIGVNKETWLIKENTFESFRISAKAKKGVIQKQHGTKLENNDYIITIIF